MPNKEKREKIFDAYSNNLHLLVDRGLLPEIKLKYDKTYICPLCLNQFSKEHLITSDNINYLTLEDVPPKKLGLKANMLTCKSCNSTSGSKIDIHLVNKIKSLFFFRSQPQGIHPARITDTESEFYFNANLEIQQNGKQYLLLNEEQNNSLEINKLNARLDQKESPILNLKYSVSKQVDLKGTNAAVLKIAYLMFFQNVGYSAILDNYYDLIRGQIKNPEQNIIAHDSFSTSHFDNLISINFGTYLVYPTASRLSIFSHFPIYYDGMSIYVSTALPFPVSDFKSDLQYSNNLIFSEKIRLMKFQNIQKPFIENIQSLESLSNFLTKNRMI